jgi:hypothetical protein
MTTTTRPEARTDIWTTGGPWRFTREEVLIGAPAEALYRLYKAAFDPLKVRSAARQVLTRAEFFDQMQDDRVDKYVAWEDTEPIGLITLTLDLESVPWISPEYFAARYPDHWARNAIYYMGIVLAHPRNQSVRFLETAARMPLERLAAQKAVIAYDMCGYNYAVRRFADRIGKVVRQYAGLEPEEIDRQLYYGLAFS